MYQEDKNRYDKQHSIVQQLFPETELVPSEEFHWETYL